MFDWLKAKMHELKLNREFNKAHHVIRMDPLMGLDINSIKAKYGNRFIELRDMINITDPIHLIAMGAPIDEYESEVKTIIVQLDNTNSKEDVLNLVYREFERWFGDAGNKENYLDLAVKIYNWNAEN